EVLEAAGVRDRELGLMGKSGQQPELILTEILRLGRNCGDDAAEPSSVELDRCDCEGRPVLERRGAVDLRSRRVGGEERGRPFRNSLDVISPEAERQHTVPLLYLESPDRGLNQLLGLRVLEP